MNESVDPPKVFVICWKYFDGSGGGSVAAYTCSRKAHRVLSLLKEASDSRQFWISEVSLES